MGAEGFVPMPEIPTNEPERIEGREDTESRPNRILDLLKDDISVPDELATYTGAGRMADYADGLPRSLTPDQRDRRMALFIHQQEFLRELMNHFELEWHEEHESELGESLTADQVEQRRQYVRSIPKDRIYELLDHTREGLEEDLNDPNTKYDDIADIETQIDALGNLEATVANW